MASIFNEVPQKKKKKQSKLFTFNPLKSEIFFFDSVIPSNMNVCVSLVVKKRNIW